MNAPTVTVIHTSPATVELFGQLLAERLPEARVVNMLDDSVLPQLRDNGGDIAAIAPRWSQYARIARDEGAAVILNACSSIGELCAPVAKALGIPVIRVDAAMAAKAVETANVVAVAATLNSTLRPTTDLLLDAAREEGREVEVVAILVGEAYAALLAGNREGHDRLVADALAQAATFADKVVLAQASMARVLPRLAPEQQARCLASPPLAVESVVKALRAG
jgi:Asp/Glu/hydantoin racemase